MKKLIHSIPFRNRLKQMTKAVAAFIVLGGLVNMAQAQTTYTPFLTNVWIVPAGTYAGIPANNGNNCRGIGISPVTTNVLFFSSTGGTNGSSYGMNVVSFASGSNFLAQLNGTGLSGGTVGSEGVRVADDGTVYGFNLSGSPASVFKIYKWPSESDTVTLATNVSSVVSGSSFQYRIGDYTDLRGSGTNTEIVAVGTGTGANVSTNFVIFRPTDVNCTNFTNFSITLPNNLTAAVGVAFEGPNNYGTNNAIWIRQSGSQNTLHIVYNPATLTAICDRTNTVDQSVCQGLKYYASTNGVKLLATVQASSTSGANQIARVFQIPSSPTAPLISVLSSNIPAVSGSVNGNSIGNVDAKNGYFVFGAPGHGFSLFNLGFVTTAPPSGLIVTASGSTFVAGYGLNAVFTATASGSVPLAYQWYETDSATYTNAISFGITNLLTLTNVSTANAGGYFVIVTNLYGKATSSVSSITVLPNGGSSLATNLWSLAPGSRPYLTTGDTQRGLGYDTNTQRLVVVTRSPTNGIILLNAADGSDAGNLDISALLAITPPGTYPINMCGVGDDGVVYVDNLITSASSDSFSIYSWGSADPSASIYQAYIGNPGGDLLGETGSIGRIGDAMAVRGAGTNTQILCPFRNGTNVVIFTTTDGVNFTPNIVYVTNLVASIGSTDPFTGGSPLALGVAFGAGNTFWAKTSGYNLRQVSFDLTSGQGAVIGSYPIASQEGPLGVDNINGYLATIGVNETPMNLAFYNLNASGGPTLSSLVDRELFPANNVNGNGTGAVAFDVSGGRVFALSSNSGIDAMTYAPVLYSSSYHNGAVLNWTGPGTLQVSTNLLSGWSTLTATSPYTNTAAAQLFFRVIR